MPVKSRRFLLLALATSCLFAASATRADEDRLAVARAEFMAAYAFAEAGVPPPPDSERLEAYPLFPYLKALRLERELTRVPLADDVDARVGSLLSTQGNAPAVRDLRRAWLLSLAARGVWSSFLANLPEGTSDTTLRCHQVTADIALGRSDGLAAAATEQWLVADKSPAACDPAFAWLRAQQALTPALIEKRARLTLVAGNAAYARLLAALLPPATAAPLLQWATLIENPQREIEALIAQPQRSVERDALLDGWTRFSRKDADAAAARYDTLLSTRKLDAAAASPYARATALGLAWSRNATALAYFNRIAPADLDTLTAEWWARSALWNGDWQQAARVIKAMPESLRTQQRWRYWALRAASALDEPDADAQLAALAGEDGWYPALASAQLHRPYAPHPEPLALNVAVQAQIAARMPFVRAHELFLCALKTQASVEWNIGFDALDPAQRVQAIALAARWGWYDQAVATASKQMIFTDYELLYPRPFDVPVRVGVALSRLPEDLIYGVIRQESLYRADAVSHSNALGLMQLLRETATRTAKRAQRPAPTGDALFDPNINVPLGSVHLRELVDRFNGQLPLAIAGYNAGPNAAARWLPPEPLAMDIWIENIPFNETRTYVQRVLWHSLVFGWRRTGKPQKLDAWRAPIAAGVVNAAASTEDTP